MNSVKYNFLWKCYCEAFWVFEIMISSLFLQVNCWSWFMYVSKYLLWLVYFRLWVVENAFCQPHPFPILHPPLLPLPLLPTSDSLGSLSWLKVMRISELAISNYKVIFSLLEWIKLIEIAIFASYSWERYAVVFYKKFISFAFRRLPNSKPFSSTGMPLSCSQLPLHTKLGSLAMVVRLILQVRNHFLYAL